MKEFVVLFKLDGLAPKEQVSALTALPGVTSLTSRSRNLWLATVEENAGEHFPARVTALGSGWVVTEQRKYHLQSTHPCQECVL